MAANLLMKVSEWIGICVRWTVEKSSLINFDSIVSNKNKAGSVWTLVKEPESVKKARGERVRCFVGPWSAKWKGLVLEC